MTKIRKQKRRKRFRANVNRKRLRNKLQKLPKIECEEIENSWELNRSIRTNLKDMGLAYDPNEALKIPSTKRGTVKIVKRDKNNVAKEIEIVEDEEINENNNKLKSEKIHVADKLEADAKAPRERMFRLPKSQVQFVTYLMEKYGDDYKAMARDRKNHYQMTWCQIRAKINTFKSIPEQYAEYLLKSGEIVLDDPTPLEETRRKLGEENVKKYCAPRKRKLPEKQKKSFWEVESIEDEEENKKDEEGESDVKKKKNSNNLKQDLSDESKNKTESSNGLKKLKLFSDDELSDDEENNEKKKISEIKNKKSNNLTLKSKEIDNKNKKKKTDEDSVLSKGKLNVDRNPKKINNLKTGLVKDIKILNKIEKTESSDSDSEEFEGDDDADGFINLSDIDEEELSEDDILDDGEFVTDSEEESN